MLIQFLVFVPLFFVCGLLVALVISNFGAAWAVLAPVTTGGVALLLILLWMKGGWRRQAVRRRTEPIDLTESETVIVENAEIADPETTAPALRNLSRAILRRRRALAALRNRLPF
jgi:hypothetical protein